jgi:adenine-specific DNA-methyltransferase
MIRIRLRMAIQEKKLVIKDLSPDWLFPTTRYRGSKRKILSWIWEELKDIPFNTVLDLFGGTGIVSLLFKRMGKSVTYNDYLFFNYTGAIALIENSKIRLSSADIAYLTQPSEYKRSGFISTTFRDYYFLDYENEWLDDILTRIENLNHFYSGKELFQKKAIAIWALGQACLIKRPFNLFHRKNLNLRLNDVERNFGNKTTWETPFSVAFERFVWEANSVVFDNKLTNTATHQNAIEYDSSNFDLVYFDPPYFFSGQKYEDYLSLYHFLDGIAQYGAWPNLIDKGASTLTIAQKYDKWPSKSTEQLTSIYESLIKKFKKSVIVISHKAGSSVPVASLERILIENGKTVSINKRQYSYALNKQNGNSHKNTECLIIGQ